VIFPILHLSNNLKEKKKKKRNIDIDLAVLPSHDTWPHSIISENSSLVRRKKPYVEKSRKMSITRNRTGGLAGNKNSHSITQSVIAKNRSTSKLIYYDQKQRSNKEP